MEKLCPTPTQALLSANALCITLQGYSPTPAQDFQRISYFVLALRKGIPWSVVAFGKSNPFLLPAREGLYRLSTLQSNLSCNGPCIHQEQTYPEPRTSFYTKNPDIELQFLQCLTETWSLLTTP
jgi:hypothetical protein